MRWGICCDDPRLAGWLQRFSRSEAVPALVIVRRSDDIDALWQSLPRVEFLPGWEQLLIAPHLTAIVAGGHSEAACSELRQFAQSDLPIYVRPHAGQGLTLAYELTLLAAERQAPLRPLWPQRADSLLKRMQLWLQDSAASVTHLELQRTQAAESLDPHAGSQTLANHQLDDFDLLKWFGLRPHRIAALQTSRPEPGHQRLSITFDAESGPAALWTYESDRQLTSQARFTLQTSQGAIVLEQDASGDWQQAAGSEIVLPALPTGPKFFDDSLTWDDAVSVWEWQDGSVRSLARRRSIELHGEVLSERTIFKTQMAAVGCLLLIVTFLLSLVYLAVAAMVPLPVWLLHTLRIVLFAPLFLFVLAQFLLPLTRSSQSAP